MDFMAGTIVGCIMGSIVVYFSMKILHEHELTEAYNKGWNDERHTIMEYIKFLESKSNATISDDLPKGSEE